MKREATHSKKAPRGFSLTEVAIVLGIIGIVMGSIWSVAGAVHQDVQREQFAEQLAGIVKNIRGAYLAKASFDSTVVPTMMPKLANMKAFAGDTVRINGGVKVVDSAFGQFVNPVASASPYNSIYVCGWRAAGSTNCEFTGGGTSNVPLFAVEALIPVGDVCIKTVVQNSNPATLPGLVEGSGRR